MNVLVPNSFQMRMVLLDLKLDGESKFSMLFEPDYFSAETKQDKMQVPISGK